MQRKRSDFDKITLASWNIRISEPTLQDHHSRFNFSVSLVREPIGAAVAAYATLTLFAKKDRSFKHYNTSFSRIPCTAERAQERFAAYVTDLEHRLAFSWVGGYHAFPQTLKLAVKVVPRFTFLGRIESFDADMRAIGERLKIPEGWVDAVLNGSQVYPHNNVSFKALNIRSPNATTVSSEPAKSMAPLCALSRSQISPTTFCRLCRLYALDYACLAGFYPMPRECDPCAKVEA